MDLLVLDHGWVLVVLNLWHFRGVHLRLLSYVRDFWELDARGLLRLLGVILCNVRFLLHRASSFNNWEHKGHGSDFSPGLIFVLEIGWHQVGPLEEILAKKLLGRLILLLHVDLEQLIQEFFLVLPELLVNLVKGLIPGCILTLGCGVLNGQFIRILLVVTLSSMAVINSGLKARIVR